MTKDTPHWVGIQCVVHTRLGLDPETSLLRDPLVVNSRL